MEAGTAPPVKKSTAQLSGLLALAFLVVAIIFLANVSDWYTTFKTIHVLFAVLWVGGGLLLTILALVAERSDDPADIAAVAKQAAFVGERVFSPAAIVVLLAGIGMMSLNNSPWDWGSFWISFGLLGFAVSFIVGIGVLAPLSKKVKASIESKGVAAPETQELIHRILLVARLDMVLLALVVVDMVAKPFLS